MSTRLSRNTPAARAKRSPQGSAFGGFPNVVDGPCIAGERRIRCLMKVTESNLPDPGGLPRLAVA